MRRIYLIALPIAFLFLSGELTLAQSEEDWGWVNKHFAAALDHFMPLEQRFGMHIAYRSNRDLHTDMLEYSFVMGLDANPGNTPGLKNYLTAHVRVADTSSIYDQMMKLHRLHPNATFDDISGMLKVKSWDVDEKTCPAIRTQYEKVKKLQFPIPMDEDVIFIHPLIHSFRFSFGTGDVNATFVDPKNSLVKWSLETRGLLEKCISEAKLTS